MTAALSTAGVWPPVAIPLVGAVGNAHFHAFLNPEGSPLMAVLLLVAALLGRNGTGAICVKRL